MVQAGARAGGGTQATKPAHESYLYRWGAVVARRWRLLSMMGILGLLAGAAAYPNLRGHLIGLGWEADTGQSTRVSALVQEHFAALVAAGIAHTARPITAAAAIMVCVFASFISSDVLEVKQIGFGLATAVALDAALVRLVLVPALMRLLGPWNWWLPTASPTCYRPAGWNGLYCTNL